MQKPGPDGAAGTARPLSIAPAQGEGLNVSRQAMVLGWGGEGAGRGFVSRQAAVLG